MNDSDQAARPTRPSEHHSVVCHECDALYGYQPIERGYVARCTRCGAVLYRQTGLALSTSAALAVTGLIALVVANTNPIIGLSNSGLASSCTLWGAVLTCWRAGSWMTAILASTTVFFMPCIELLLSAWVLVPLSMGRLPPALPEIARVLQAIKPWTMVQVFMLGILITIVKLAGMASVIVGPGLWSFAALALLTTAISSFEWHALWSQWEGHRP
jgi:paraquat-inducible protein A